VRDSFGDDLRPVVRADAGYFAAELAHTAVGLGCDFAVAARRNPAMWRAAATVGETNWSPAIGMHAAQVAGTDYAPAGWPPHTYTIIRRVRVDGRGAGRGARVPRRRLSAPARPVRAAGGRAVRVRAVRGHRRRRRQPVLGRPSPVPTPTPGCCTPRRADTGWTGR